MKLKNKWRLYKNLMAPWYLCDRVKHLYSRLLIKLIVKLL